MTHQSERDAMLEVRWRALLQARDGPINLALRHQCMLEACVVRPFVCAPHFYGCTRCGQSHLCYADVHGCLAATAPDGATLTCQYSGQVLDGRATPSFVGTHVDQLIADDNARTSCRQRVAAGDHDNQSRGLYKPRRTLLYTNSRLALPPRVASEAAPRHRARAHPDEAAQAQAFIAQLGAPPRPVLRVWHEPASSAEESDEQSSEEEAEEERGARGDADDEYDAWGAGRYEERAPPQSNAAYWDAEYAFLLECDLAELQAQDGEADTRPVERIDVLEQARTAPDAWALAEPVRARVAEAVRGLLELLVAPCPERQALLARLQAHYGRYAENVAALVYRAPPMARLLEERRAASAKHAHAASIVARHVTHEYVAGDAEATEEPGEAVLPARQLCEALLLQLLGAPYCDEDQWGNRIEIWHACPWLASLAPDALYGEAVTGSNNKRRRLTQAPCSRKRVKQAVACVHQCLDHYRGHALWLRHFILDRRQS